MPKLFIKIVILMSFLLLTACSEPSLPKVGLSLPTQREERWVRDKEAMQLQASKLGVDLAVMVSDNNAAAQIRQCESLLSQGVEVLILAPHDARSAATIVEMANKKNVPVISYDRLILNAKVAAYLSFDNVEVGRIQALYLLKEAPKGKYIVLSGSPTDNNASMFKAGALEILSPELAAQNIEIILDASIMDWKPIEAYRLVQQKLSELKQQSRLQDLVAVLAPNDNTARGVITALDELGLSEQVIVTGQDGEVEGAKMIVAGKQNMTVFKDTRLLAKKAIELSLDFIGHKAQFNSANAIYNGLIDVPTLLLKPVLVTKDTLDEVFIDSGYIHRQDIYGSK